MCLVYLIGHGLDDTRLAVLFSDNSMPVKWVTKPPIQTVPPVLVPEIMQQGSEMSTRLQKRKDILLRPPYTFVVCRGTTLPFRL